MANCIHGLPLSQSCRFCEEERRIRTRLDAGERLADTLREAREWSLGPRADNTYILVRINAALSAWEAAR